MLSFQPKTKSMTFTCFTKLKHRSYVYDMFYVYATIWQPRTAHRWDEKKKKSKDGINDNNRQMTIDRKLQIAISRDYRAWLESDVNIKNI